MNIKLAFNKASELVCAIKPNLMRRMFGKAPIFDEVLILCREELLEYSKKHPFNENLKRFYNRHPKFPEFLRLFDEEGVYFVICDIDHRIIASTSLRSFPPANDEIMWWQISTHRDYTRNGLANRLIEAVVEYLNNERPDIKRVVLTPYEEMGEKYLRKKWLLAAGNLKAELFEQYNNRLVQMPRQSFGD